MENKLLLLRFKNLIKRPYNKAAVFFRDGKKPSVVEWVILGMISAFMFFNFIYADLYAWTIWSITYWDALFDGRFFEYYKYCYDNVYGLYNIFNASEIFMPALLSVWNFPLYIAKQFFGVNIIYSVGALLWAKSIYLAAQILCVVLLHKIAERFKFSATNAKWLVFAFCASSFLFLGAYMDCQTDILCMPFYLASFLFLLDGKEKKAALMSAFSVSLKPFPLIIFIPMVLIAEKNLFKCAKYAAIALSIYVLGKILFIGAPYYYISVSSLSLKTISDFLVINFNLGIGGVALFPVAFVAICIFCYHYKYTNENEKNSALLYAAVAALLAYYIFADFQAYRLILFAPFGALLIMQNVKYNNLLSVSVALFMLSAMLSTIPKEDLLYEKFNESTLERMLLSRIFGSTLFLDRVYVSAYDLMNNIFDLDAIIGGVRAVFLLSAGIILYLAFPAHKRDNFSFAVKKELIWLQIMPILFIAAICCMSYFALR